MVTQDFRRNEINLPNFWRTLSICGIMVIDVVKGVEISDGETYGSLKPDAKYASDLSFINRLEFLWDLLGKRSVVDSFGSK